MGCGLPAVSLHPCAPESRGCSSVGRALAWHARGQGFDSPQLHFETCRLAGRRARPAVRHAADAPIIPVDLGSLALVPVGIDLGVLLRDGLEVGGALEGAPAVGGHCAPCAGWTGRSSFHVRAHLAPDATVDPWHRVATGLELVSMPGQVGVATASPFFGADFPSLELGLDVRAAPRLRLGAFARGDLVVLFRTLDGLETPAWMTNNVPARFTGGLRAEWSLPMPGATPEVAPPGHRFERRLGGVLLGMCGVVLAALSTYLAVTGFTATTSDTPEIGRAVGVLGLLGVAGSVPMMIFGFSQDTVVVVP